jgi:aerobic-type carbon monoxide dehydrogenase small subunit (CoxS/CutS family)
MAISITVNGKRRSVDASADTPLLYVLRDNLELDGPVFGCGLAQCGACAVLLGDAEIRSCVTPVGAVGDRAVTTIEGLGHAKKLHPLQQAWIDEQVPQCGYCQSGMMIAAASLLNRNPHPSKEQIIAGMDGHLCRCGTQPRIVKAIARAASSSTKATA